MSQALNGVRVIDITRPLTGTGNHNPYCAAPHRFALLVAAAICFAGAGALFVWRRRAAICKPGIACCHPATTALLACVITVGLVLAVLGYLYA